MKIIRLGMTESGILFILFLKDNSLSNSYLKLLNWLYTTGGYYDKKVKGNYFNFDTTCITDNYNTFIKQVILSIKDAEIQILFHKHFLNIFPLHKDEFMKHYKIKKIDILNDTPFEGRLENIFSYMVYKKVLVVSSFDGLIKHQYDSGNVTRIYNGFPNIKLKVLKMPYCFFNNGPHENYFETLEYIFDQIKNIKFDIALLACGCYGHVLGHKIHTELNKNSIYIGGDITTMFGILSERTKNDNKPKVNKYWITEIPDEYKPPNYKLIENGCYW